MRACSSEILANLKSAFFQKRRELRPTTKSNRSPAAASKRSSTRGPNAFGPTSLLLNDLRGAWIDPLRSDLRRGSRCCNCRWIWKCRGFSLPSKSSQSRKWGLNGAEEHFGKKKQMLAGDFSGSIETTVVPWMHDDDDNEDDLFGKRRIPMGGRSMSWGKGEAVGATTRKRETAGCSGKERKAEGRAAVGLISQGYIWNLMEAEFCRPPSVLCTQADFSGGLAYKSI
ncbi:hypothetical protein K0M31_010047 [Melipona bicolor]|uniref:Uncharacterized protein n=1 Tax=Melipona bicolor TaxID=60889 RepID=A0AA40KIR6_9HYME|nr:hypothetical protein K0M31_010047 [Melipona bicolor]